MNELQIYANKKFDILKVIKMVLKRKCWGEKYTLYSTPTHEVFTTMQLYNFEDRYALFKIVVNEKTGNGYYSDTLKIYTDREDYNLKFVNNLLLKTVKNNLKSYRKKVFETEAHDIFPYVWRSGKEDDEWIKQFKIQEEINKINDLTIDEETINQIIDDLIERKINEYETEFCFKKRDEYIENNLMSDREKPILDLIEEIEKELRENNE